ncbi:hypothetical protein [Luteolibacter sp. LG18]|uniref:hypothetical protein n=1 Tax=Luteolibacter sp. LG18 TaxID=2819286 RepID=UPI002B2C375A|nr:hypothetical protein llg_19210 [Luteolibacter sp. LG18]
MKRFLIPIAAILAGLAAGFTGARFLPGRELPAPPQAASPPPAPVRKTAALRSFIEERMGQPEGERPAWYQSERVRLRQSTGSPYRCSSVLDQAIEDLSGDQLVEMLTRKGFPSVEETVRAFTRLAEIDPVWAMDVRAKTPLGLQQMNEAIIAVLAVWVRTNAPQALDWCYNIPDSGNRQQHSLELTNEWLKVDPAAVARNYDRLENARGPGSFSAGFPDKLMRAWIAKDADAAGAWVAALAPGAKKEQLQQAYLKAGGK